MSAIVDARGLSCPQPVLMTLNEIKSGGKNKINVLVDNEASRENVIRAAENQGYKVTDIQQQADDITITLTKG